MKSRQEKWWLGLGLALWWVGLLPATTCSAQSTQSEPAAEKKSPLPRDGFGEPPSAQARLKDIPLGPTKLDVGFNVRMRWESMQNFDVRSYGMQTATDFLLLRLRVRLDWKIAPQAHMLVQLQDARYVWSDLDRSLWPGECPFWDELDLHEAYLEWRHIGGTVLGFKLGRQTISYADERVFGAGEARNSGRYWWDGAKVYLDTDPLHVDLIYAQRVKGEQSGFNNSHYPYHLLAIYAQMAQQAWSDFLFTPHFFYVLRYDDHGNISGEGGKGNERRHSIGVHFNSLYAQRWDFSGTLAMQTGDYGADQINAYGWNLKVGHTWKTAWQPRLGSEITYASGDTCTNDAKRGTFDGIFGAVDRYYGRMNLVAWMNLEDYQIAFSLRPQKALNLAVDFHWFRLAETTDAWYRSSGKAQRTDPTGTAGRNLGREVDLTLRWQALKNVELLTGYGCFFPGAYVEKTGGNTGTAQWLMVQGTYRF